MSQAHPSWADEVEREEEAEGPRPDPGFGAKFEPRDGWHEGLDVRRGQSRQKLDTQHGFMRQIVRNQRDRDQYERAWQEAYAAGDEYQKKWGRAKVQRDGRDWGMPEPWRSAPAPAGPSPEPANPWAEQLEEPHSKADDSSWWRKPAPAQPGAGASSSGGGGGGERDADQPQGAWAKGPPQQMRVLQRPVAAPPAVAATPAEPAQPRQAPQRQPEQQQPPAQPPQPPPQQQVPAQEAAQPQYVMHYEQQQQQQQQAGPGVPPAPIMVQLPGGGYALMSPQAFFQAQQAQQAQHAQGGPQLRQQVVYVPVAMAPPPAQHAQPATPPSPEAIGVGQGQGPGAKGGAVPGSPGVGARRAVKMRAGFGTYRPPPVLTGVSTTTSKEVREIFNAPARPAAERPVSRESQRGAAGPQQEQRAPRVLTVPRATSAAIATAAAAAAAKAAASSPVPARGAGAAEPVEQPQPRKPQAKQAAPPEPPAAEAGEEGEAKARRRRKRGGKGRRRRGGQGGAAGEGEAGSDEEDEGEEEGRLEALAGADAALALGRWDSMGRRRSGTMVMAEQAFDDDGAASGLDMGDVSGTSPGSTATPHSLLVTVSGRGGRAASRLSGASAGGRVVRLSASPTKRRGGGGGVPAATGPAAAAVAASYYSGEEGQDEEAGYTSDSSGWYTEEEPTEQDLLAAAAAAAASSPKRGPRPTAGAHAGAPAAAAAAAAGSGKEGREGEGQEGGEEQEELVVRVDAGRRAARREVRLTPGPASRLLAAEQAQPQAQDPPLPRRERSPSKRAFSSKAARSPSPAAAAAAAPAPALAPPPGISAALRSAADPPAPHFVQPAAGTPAVQEGGSAGQAPKRVLLGPMQRVLKQHLQQAVESRSAAAPRPAAAAAAAGTEAEAPAEPAAPARAANGEAQREAEAAAAPGGAAPDAEALPQREPRRRRGREQQPGGAAPPGLTQPKQQQALQQEKGGEEGPQEGDCEEAATPAGYSPEQALVWRQERVLQRILKLERRLGVTAGAGGEEGGSNRPARRARAPLVLYMPPRRDRPARA